MCKDEVCAGGGPASLLPCPQFLRHWADTCWKCFSWCSTVPSFRLHTALALCSQLQAGAKGSEGFRNPCHRARLSAAIAMGCCHMHLSLSLSVCVGGGCLPASASFSRKKRSSHLSRGPEGILTSNALGREGARRRVSSVSRMSRRGGPTVLCRSHTASLSWPWGLDYTRAAPQPAPPRPSLHHTMC